MVYPNYDEKTLEFLNYYANLLIMQYKESQKNKDFIKIFINTLYMDGVYDIFKNFFDIDNASGKHLEILGRYVGAYRTYEDYVLTDEELKILIKLLSAKNGMGANIAEISDLLYNVFGNKVIIFNNYDMSISYYVSLSLAEFFEKVLLKAGYLPVPQGIGVKLIIETPEADKVFGYADARDGLNTSVIVGYNDAYKEYHEDWTWLESEWIKTKFN